MRRLVTWYLPLVAGLLLSVIFGWGFVRGVTGNAGEVVRTSQGIAGDLAQTEEPGTSEDAARDLIVILGDSLARGTGDELGEGIGGRLGEILDERGRDHETANIAVNGARTPDLLAQLDRPSVTRLVSRASVVVVSIGGNDFFGERDMFGVAEAVPDDPGLAIETIQERIENAVTRIRALNPEAPIFLLGLYNPFTSVPEGDRLSPVVARWNGGLIDRFSSDPGVVIVQTSDLFLAHERLSADRFHPNGEGYGLIARRIADAL